MYDTALLLTSLLGYFEAANDMFSCLLTYKSPKPILCSNMYNYKEQCYYIIRKYVLPLWSEHNYIFSHRIVHWVYNYMFRPCILAIVRLYCKLNKQLYYICVGYCGGNEISSYSSGWHGLGIIWTGANII